MSIQSVLFEYFEDSHLFSSSAILLNKRWVILPAAAFLIYLSDKKNITQYLTIDTSKLIQTNYLNLSPENLKIIFKTDDKQKFNFYLAKYIGLFSCKNIQESLTDLALSCGDANENDLDFNTLLPLFMILDIKMEATFAENHFYNSINDLLKLSHSLSLCRGNMVCIESTPFGNRQLLISYCQGVICNWLGMNNCLILTDASTAPGCEGAPIFAFKKDNKYSTKIPIGIVISSLNAWRGEHTGLTLGAMLVPLLAQLLPQKQNWLRCFFSNKHSVLNSVDKTIVQIFCGNGWGTGILIDKKNGIFITASHVVKTENVDQIKIKWKNHTSNCSLIYKTKSPEIFDIAVLRSSANFIEYMTPIKFATKLAVKGENVFAAGYPIFHSEDTIFPVVTKGNISLIDSCILHTTCCILPGASGGAILRENGELLGIIVCHTTVNSKHNFFVYPKINMVIPISIIYKPLIEYIKKKDITLLEDLQTKDSYVLNKWGLLNSKL